MIACRYGLLPLPCEQRPPIVTPELTQVVSWSAPTKYTKATVRERNEFVKQTIQAMAPLAHFRNIKRKCDLTKSTLTDALRTLLHNEEIERVRCKGTQGTHYGYRSIK